jgi:hypothetical protein
LDYVVFVGASLFVGKTLVALNVGKAEKGTVDETVHVVALNAAMAAVDSGTLIWKPMMMMT